MVKGGRRRVSGLAEGRIWIGSSGFETRPSVIFSWAASLPAEAAPSPIATPAALELALAGWGMDGGRARALSEGLHSLFAAPRPPLLATGRWPNWLLETRPLEASIDSPLSHVANSTAVNHFQVPSSPNPIRHLVTNQFGRAYDIPPPASTVPIELVSAALRRIPIPTSLSPVRHRMPRMLIARHV